MTRKVPIWLKDDDGHQYHVKLDKDGYPYIVDAGLNKRMNLGAPDLSDLYVGAVFDARAIDYGRYTVIRNALHEAAL